MVTEPAPRSWREVVHAALINTFASVAILLVMYLTVMAMLLVLVNMERVLEGFSD